ncbi:MAG: hypothetical protein IPL65_11440 [Lewinellaceae bacterium]|nr:hypothetical protein [Lewinellaceae bacterium]
MLISFNRRPVFAAIALLIFSFSNTAFRKPEQPVGLPDLQVITQVSVVKLNSTTFYYVFTIQNTGTARADLRNMKILTTYAWDGYQEGRTDKYLNMRYDTPPNPNALAPGEKATVRFKVSVRPRQLPNFFVVDILLDVNDSVQESNESNNTGGGNSIGLG